MNAGRPLGQLAACFVVPVEDSTTGVFEAVRWAAEIQKTGGGTGFSFSRLRPAGDRVASTGGTASGPVTLMQVFDIATEAIKQGGTRRGANMGMLRVDHPDILEFIAIKLDPTRMRNFNLSVAVTDAFMRAVAAGTTYDLVNPRTDNVTGRLDARRVFDAIANAAWAVGDPGLVFIDRVNELQPTPDRGVIEATNPCVTGDTRVWVEGQGMVEIRELVGSTPRTATLDDGRVVFRRATRVFATGVKPVLRLATVEGVELRLTADHLVATDSGEVMAAMLEPGDRLRWLAAPVLGDVPRDCVDGTLGELVGWLVGDGHFTNHSAGKPTAVLGFYGADKREAAPRLLAAARRIAGAADLELGAVDDRDFVYIRSQRLRRALEAVGIDPSCKRQIPELIWRGTPALVAGFIRGLISVDGSVQGTIANGASVRLANNELGLLRGGQQLLLRFGIRSVIYANRRTESVRLLPDADGVPREYSCAAQHELVISRASLCAYLDAIGFIVAAKTHRLTEMLAGYTRGPHADRQWLTVQSVEPDGEAEVFDLTEPTTSHFFANGVLVHNCGEQPLLPFESCTLGSIDVGRFVVAGDLDWDRLRIAIRDSVRFLDDVIDANRYPLVEIERATKDTRKIGLGIMGWADALAALDIAYDSEPALELATRLATFLEAESLAASEALAAERGPFPAWHGSRWERDGHRPLRNATTTTIAPTGTISIIAGCSSGIEPLYALAYRRNVLDGAELDEVNPMFRRIAEARGVATPELFAAIAEHGGVRGVEGVPADLQRRFPTAHDVSIAMHVRMQATFQRYVHAAVSKTINLRHDATPADVKAAYQLAYELGCKGITVYRDGSREGQVLVTGARAAAPVAVPGCPECGNALVLQARCQLCRHCGWSVCSV
ncbi:MAG TPA: LAGLIDADG family homing endonuclease [Kofleriaceae bacterium]|nr:LAGLIDADG family homing endonuclease [Kofleriaceae bacterium]